MNEQHHPFDEMLNLLVDRIKRHVDLVEECRPKISDEALRKKMIVALSDDHRTIAKLFILIMEQAGSAELVSELQKHMPSIDLFVTDLFGDK